MRKQLYVFQEGKPLPTVIRNYTTDDFTQLIRIQQESFPPPFPSDLWWNEEQLTNHVTLFPQGALCAEIDGQIVGSMTSLLVNEEQTYGIHTWDQITDSGYIRNHQPDGNILYVVDLCVTPAFRKTGLGKWLMQSMYEVVVHMRVDRLLGGGRMPGYGQYAALITAEQYLDKVILGELKDPVISFMLRCGRTPVGVVKHYLEDTDSDHYAALMAWTNPFK